jgi:hypothetical protein
MPCDSKASPGVSPGFLHLLFIRENSRILTTELGLGEPQVRSVQKEEHRGREEKSNLYKDIR